MNKRIALGAVLLGALVPSTAQAQQVTPIKTDFTLTKGGLDLSLIHI